MSDASLRLLERSPDRDAYLAALLRMGWRPSERCLYARPLGALPALVLVASYWQGALLGPEGRLTTPWAMDWGVTDRTWGTYGVHRADTRARGGPMLWTARQDLMDLDRLLRRGERAFWDVALGSPCRTPPITTTVPDP